MEKLKNQMVLSGNIYKYIKFDITMSILQLKQITELKAKTGILTNKELTGISEQVVDKQKDDPIFKAKTPDFLFNATFGRPRNINAPFLREISKNPYIFSIIKTLQDEASSTKWDIQVKEGFEVKPEDEKVRHRIKEFFLNPNSENESFPQILRKLIYDICVLDSGVIVKVYNKMSELCQFKVIDGGSVNKNPDQYGNVCGKDKLDVIPLNTFMKPKNNSPFALKQLETQFESAYGSLASYYQFSTTMMNATPIPFGKKEIVYIMQHPSTYGVYSVSSPVQAAVDIVLSLIFGAKYHLDYFMNGNGPEGIISLPGATQITTDTFKEKINSTIMTGKDQFGMQRRIGHRMPVVGNDNVNFTPLSFPSKDMEIIDQQQWFTKILWMQFGVTPSEMGFCYSEDTTVLTNNGFKNYWEIEEEDKIATIIEKDNSIEYIKPTNIHTFNVVDRKFHYYKNNCIDALVSDDHRMYYRTVKDDKYRMSPSNEIEVNTVKFLQGGLKWVGTNLDTFKIPLIEYTNNKDINREQEIEFDIKDFCEFFGYWIADGSVLKAMDEKRQYPIKITKIIEEDIETMRPLMEKLKFKHNGHAWVLANKSLAKYLHQFGGSSEKFIPEKLKNLPINKLEILFNAMMFCDGSWTKDGNSPQYCTSSKRLSNDVLEIMLKLGYKASIYTREFKNKNWNTSYTISGNKTQIEPRLIIDKQRTEELYTGVMWCPSVDNRPFITERNGKIGIHYNTEDASKNVDENQTKIAQRKGVKPILDNIAFYLNSQIIPELDENNMFEFVWDSVDIDEDIKMRTLQEQEIRMRIKSPQLIMEEEGIDANRVKKDLEDNKPDEEGFEFSSMDKEEDEDDEYKDTEVKHKYIKRTGSSGNYEYFYKDDLKKTNKTNNKKEEVVNNESKLEIINVDYNDIKCKQIEKLSSEEKEAIDKYVTDLDFYPNLNQMLLGNDFDDDTYSEYELESLSERISEAIDKHKIETNATLYRGLRNTNEDFNIGDTFEHLSFFSSTPNRDMAEGFAEPTEKGDKPVLLRFNIKKGDTAMKIDNKYGQDEDEILLDKETNFKIINKSKEDGIDIIDLEIIREDNDTETKSEPKIKEFPKTSATEVVMDSFEKEYQEMVKEVIDSVK